ncbi:hypothetical protein FACS1894120_3730 [Clostridia bacterium]|nr:hypothetical protein FACS1894120_3730 [Clostridia bacterium]
MKKAITAIILAAALLTGCEKIGSVVQTNVSIPTSFSGVYNIAEGSNSYTALVRRDDDGMWQISPSDPPELAGLSENLTNIFGENGLAESRASVYWNGEGMTAKTFEDSAAAKITAAIDATIYGSQSGVSGKLGKVRQKDGTYKLTGDNFMIILNGDNVVYAKAGSVEIAAV